MRSPTRATRSSSAAAYLRAAPARGARRDRRGDGARPGGRWRWSRRAAGSRSSSRATPRASRSRRATFARSLAKHGARLVVDAGCALALARRYPDAGVELVPTVETPRRARPRRARVARARVARARRRARALARPLSARARPRRLRGAARACSPAPRARARRVRRRGASTRAAPAPEGCSRSTMPERRAHDRRRRGSHEHARAGGGRVVTACASSLLALAAARRVAASWSRRRRRPRHLDRAGGAAAETLGVSRATASSPTARPRSTIARRVLASFAITVVAFAITLGWSVVGAAARGARTASSSGAGYVPVALRLAQLRADADDPVDARRRHPRRARAALDAHPARDPGRRAARDVRRDDARR